MNLNGWGALVLPLLVSCTDYDLRNNEQTDAWTQETRNVVDVLLVVDNSCSMVDEQEKLASNFGSFIEAFEDADVNYQIGVITTDTDDIGQSGRLQGPLVTSEMPYDEAEALFVETVSLGTTGSGYEAGLDAARLALSPELLAAENQDFLREEASLSIVFVSDEEDSSPDPVDLYLDFFYAVKSPEGYEAYRDSRLMNMSAVVGPLPDGCSISEDDQYPAVPGSRYIDLATRTNGIISSICDAEFGPLVRELGLNISGLQAEFYLSRWPDLATLVVKIDEEETTTWSYLAEQNSIVFDQGNLPPSASTITAHYTVSARPNTEESGS